MFSHNSASKDDARHLLSHDNIQDDEDHEVVWEQSERHTETPSELWEQDPLSPESHELQEASRLESQPSSSQPKVKRVKASSKDHGIAGTDLQAEFERIFSPVKHDQEERGRFHNDLDAACEAYSSRLEEMKDQQREREEAIEKPWLIARRKRNWQRFRTGLHNVGLFATCFWGGTVARFEELPAQIAWPPPHLSRMREHHTEERKALREAHLAVVHELKVKYGLGTEEDELQESHVCVERRLLEEALRAGQVSLDDNIEESRVP